MGGENEVAGLPIGLAVIIGLGGTAGALAAPDSDWHFDRQGRVQVDVRYDCSREPPTQALSSEGFSASSSVRLPPFCVVEGWVTLDSLPRIAAVDGVSGVNPPSYAVHPRLRPSGTPPQVSTPVPSVTKLAAQPAVGAANAIDRNGVSIMRADQFVSQTGVSGAGVKVGVQSAGISSLQTIQSRSELPAVQVVQPSDGTSSPTGDEGTALLEEVHAVAPGAGLVYCGPSTFVEYTSCLSQMIAAGASILVDDLIFPQQGLLSSDSTAVQAIEQLHTTNPSVAFFTAGGNYNGSYWEGAYSPVAVSSVGLSPLTCTDGGSMQTDNYVAEFDGSPSQLLSLTASSSIPVVFTWADPPAQNASKFDLYWMRGGAQVGCLATSTGTSTEVSKAISLTAGSYTVYIGTPDASSAGKFLKLWAGGDGLTSLSKSTTGSVVTPQAFAAGSVTVGAVNGSDGVGKNIEPFSSLGPITVVFPTQASLQSPVLVAPDGINVDAAGTYFQSDLFPDGNFYGTSAAAPNAAAVAALIRSAFPALTVDQLLAALKAAAAQLGAASPDGTYGYGRIDAIGALGTFPTPTITSLPDSSLTAGTSSPSYPFTVTGSGALHFAVTSSNTTSIPAAVVAAGSPGVTITPADCGVSTFTCSVVVMPANGPGGTVTVTLAALDGANRSAKASMTVTVAGTQAPPSSSPPPQSAAGSGGGGGALDWALLAVLLLMQGRRRSAGAPPRLSPGTSPGRLMPFFATMLR